MTKGEENIVLNERDELIQTIEAQQQMIFEANKQIQAQQQEINLLIMEITELRESNQALKDYAENADADKDEQAGRIMRYDTALKQAKGTLELSKIHIESGFTTVHMKIDKSIRTIDALLGGKEDGILDTNMEM